MAQLVGDHAFYTVKEAAEEVRCSPRTIYRYINDGVIEAKHGPTAMLIPRESLQAFMDSFPDAGGAR
jgi:excisionase family DNA binding protein